MTMCFVDTKRSPVCAITRWWMGMLWELSEFYGRDGLKRKVSPQSCPLKTVSVRIFNSIWSRWSRLSNMAAASTKVATALQLPLASVYAYMCSSRWTGVSRKETAENTAWNGVIQYSAEHPVLVIFIFLIIFSYMYILSVKQRTCHLRPWYIPVIRTVDIWGAKQQI